MVHRNFGNLANPEKMIDEDGRNLGNLFPKLIDVCGGISLIKIFNPSRRYTYIDVDK